jgi:predicted lipase
MIPQQHKELINLCSNYSKNAYKKTVKGKFIEDKETDTQAYVSYEDNNIIISGQGTTSFKDWSIDFQIWRNKAEYTGNTNVHAGFLKAYESIRLHVHLEISKLKIENENVKSIICTGHSLFGAIATLCALDCAFQYDLPVKCVTFGSPRVGSKAFAELFNSSVDVSYRCVRCKDPVAFTPLPLRFTHVRGGLKLDKDVTKLPIGSLSLCKCFGCKVKDHSMDNYYNYCTTLN